MKTLIAVILVAGCVASVQAYCDETCQAINNQTLAYQIQQQMNRNFAESNELNNPSPINLGAETLGIATQAGIAMQQNQLYQQRLNQQAIQANEQNMNNTIAAIMAIRAQQQQQQAMAEQQAQIENDENTRTALEQERSDIAEQKAELEADKLELQKEKIRQVIAAYVAKRKAEGGKPTDEDIQWLKNQIKANGLVEAFDRLKYSDTPHPQGVRYPSEEQGNNKSGFTDSPVSFFKQLREGTHVQLALRGYGWDKPVIFESYDLETKVIRVRADGDRSFIKEYSLDSLFDAKVLE